MFHCEVFKQINKLIFSTFNAKCTAEREVSLISYKSCNNYEI